MIILNNEKKYAFTLAEVLITITVLGIVSAIVISNIIINYQKTLNITKLKRAFSSFTKTFEEARFESNCTTVKCMVKAYGIDWDNTGSQNNNYFNRLRIFIPEVENETASRRCVPREQYSLDGTLANSGKSTVFYEGDKQASGFCLRNGMGVAFWGYGMSSKNPWNGGCANNRSSCGNLYLFLDGTRKKAVYGRNVFEFSITSNGDLEFSDGTCNPKTKNRINGLGCGRRIMRNNWKMDY